MRQEAFAERSIPLFPMVSPVARSDKNIYDPRKPEEGKFVFNSRVPPFYPSVVVTPPRYLSAAATGLTTFLALWNTGF